MRRINTPQDLERFRDEILSKRDLNRPCVTVCGGTGCHALDQLIGSRVAVANVEFRFPLTRTLSLGILPIGFPPIEGALFYDVGMAWQNGSTLEFSPSQCRGFADCRTPLRSWGGSIRANFLGIVIMRVDYTRPLDRAYDHPYWTLSIGPTF